MTQAVTVDNVSFDDTQQQNNIIVVKRNMNNDHHAFDAEDFTLSDHSNSNSHSHSQHTTTNNSNHSTDSRSRSLLRSPMQIESKSNTELSIDNDSASMNIDDHEVPNTSRSTTEDIIHQIIEDPDNILQPQTDENDSADSPSPLSRAVRSLLEHESQRLKAENGRLMRKVEKMRCIRTSMQNIFDQLQENDHQLQSMEHEEETKEEKIEQEEEEELEIEHLNDLQHIERMRHNSHRQFLLKQKQREERKALRQQRLLRFAKSRLQQQQLHYNNTLQIQNANVHSSSVPHLAPFIPRICSTPACNHPVRAGGRSICCRGCLAKQHTATCHQRALKMIERRRSAEANADSEDYAQVIAPPHIVPHHHHHHHHRRTRSHSTSNILGAYHSNRSKPRRHRRHSVNYLFCDKCRSKFNCLADLERHRAIHHSPVRAAIITSGQRNQRMPPPIPELTSSFHTTAANQTKNAFRYKPNANDDKLSRLGMLRRRIRGGNGSNIMQNEHDRKRKHSSLSQLFSTFLPNARRHHEDNHDDDEEDEDDDEKGENDANKRRSLSSIFIRNNNEDIDDVETERKKIKALRRKLEQRRKAILLSNTSRRNVAAEEEKMSRPSMNMNNHNDNHNNSLFDELAAAAAERSSSSRRRSSGSNAVRIMPFITNSDNDEHDEEEKSVQPIRRRRHHEHHHHHHHHHHHVHHRPVNPQHATHRIHNNHNNRPRLRQPFIPNEDRNHHRTSRRNSVRRSRFAAAAPAANNPSSLYVNRQRDEEIARLVQERQSLFQTFNDTISRHASGNSHHAHSTSFDVNALRFRQRRTANTNVKHRHSLSLNRVDLTYLPIRCVQQSDIRKGNDSSSNCSICQEKFRIGDKVKTLPCFHFFHVEEIDRWLANSRDCPVCRHSIDKINFK